MRDKLSLEKEKVIVEMNTHPEISEKAYQPTFLGT
jgi:hypothetical protein